MDDDLPFLDRVYASTRTDELARTGWPEEQVRAFLFFQARAQHQHYQLHYADASFDVVLVGDRPAGRLYVHRRGKEIRIVDISLLPEFRRGGIGTHLLRGILHESDASGVPVTIHVEFENPARSLYDRLGFAVLEDKGMYLLMERKPRP